MQFDKDFVVDIKEQNWLAKIDKQNIFFLYLDMIRE